MWVMEGSLFNYTCMLITIASFSRKIIILSLHFLCTFVENQLAYVWIYLRGHYFLVLYLSIFVQFHIILITITLKLILKLVLSLNIFFSPLFFNIILAVLGSLHYHLKLRTRLLIYRKNPTGILNGIMWSRWVNIID